MRAMVVAPRASRACWVRVEVRCGPWWWVVGVWLRRRRMRKVRAAVAKRVVRRMPGVRPSAGAAAVPVAGVWGVVVMMWWAWSMGMGAWLVVGWVIMVTMRAAPAMVRAW